MSSIPSTAFMTSFDLDDHAYRAVEQSAMHATRLAIVRWTRGESFPQMQVDAALRSTAQERWYSNTQRNFREWLEQGGFSHPAETDATVLVPSLSHNDGVQHCEACLG